MILLAIMSIHHFMETSNLNVCNELISGLDYIDNELFYKGRCGILFQKAYLNRDDSMNNIYVSNGELLYSGLSRRNIEIIKISYRDSQYKLEKVDKLAPLQEGAHIIFTPTYVYIIDYEKNRTGKYYRGTRDPLIYWLGRLEEIHDERFYKEGCGTLFQKAYLKRDDCMNNIYINNGELLYSGLSRENIEIIKISCEGNQYEAEKSNNIKPLKEGARIIFTPAYVYIIDYEKKETGKYRREIRNVNKVEN